MGRSDEDEEDEGEDDAVNDYPEHKVDLGSLQEDESTMEKQDDLSSPKATPTWAQFQEKTTKALTCRG